MANSLNKEWNMALSNLKSRVRTPPNILVAIFLLMVTDRYCMLAAQPVISNDNLPDFEIEARVRNGVHSYEGVLYTPSTPPPGQPGGQQWQMNPLGTPVWNSNGNMYGDVHSFLFTYTKATGTSVWRLDFNRDGDYDDPEESVTNIAPSLVGKGFKYINIWGQGYTAGFTVFLIDFTINNVNLGSFSSSYDENPFYALFEDVSGLFNDITISGDFSFAGDGDRVERPRIWVRLGTANDSPSCAITDPDGGAHFFLTDTITIDAMASDNDGTVTVVEFYDGTTYIGEDSLMPFSVIWYGGTPGSHSLTAKAIDNLGAVIISTIVVITIDANIPPACSIAGPTNETIYFDPDTIVIDAQATDINDSISVVEFFLDDVNIGWDNFAPYRNSALIDTPMGTYTITAQSTDSFSATTISSPITITVRCIREDLDNNGTVNTNDFLLFLASFGITCTICDPDFNDDGGVSTVDFLHLLTKIGYTCN